MTIKYSVIFAFILMHLPAFGDTDNNPIFGMDYLSGKVANEDYAPNLNIRGGKYLYERLALEGHVAWNLAEPTVRQDAAALDKAVSLFVRPELSLSNRSRFHGLIGFTQGTVVSGPAEVKLEEGNSGLSFGVGTNVLLSRNTRLKFEYINYLEEGSSHHLDGLEVGLQGAF